MFYSVVVGMMQMFPASKGACKHENGGFGCVKVGDEGIDQLELEAGVDENVVLTLGFSSFGVIFESAGDSGADGDDAMMRGLGGIDGV